jgi:agmatine deiminase
MFLSAPSGQPAALVDWEYNAWGGKYPPFDKDNAVPRQLAERLSRKRFAPGMVLEGGSIEGNSEGLILTTESCLLDPRRNAGLSREQVEQYLIDYCCASRVLWLSGGEVAVERDERDANFAPLAQNARDLRELAEAHWLPWTIHELPMPRPIVFNDQRLPGSYANFYIANGVVVVPQFDDPADAEALDVLRPLFPNREVIGLAARDLVLGLGAFHCMTQQEPRL